MPSCTRGFPTNANEPFHAGQQNQTVKEAWDAEIPVVAIVCVGGYVNVHCNQSPEKMDESGKRAILEAAGSLLRAAYPGIDLQVKPPAA